MMVEIRAGLAQRNDSASPAADANISLALEGDRCGTVLN